MNGLTGWDVAESVFVKSSKRLHRGSYQRQVGRSEEYSLSGTALELRKGKRESWRLTRQSCPSFIGPSRDARCEACARRWQLELDEDVPVQGMMQRSACRARRSRTVKVLIVSRGLSPSPDVLHHPHPRDQHDTMT